jgi:hypothetical protein
MRPHEAFSRRWRSGASRWCGLRSTPFTSFATQVRRNALHHALLAYVFGTVINAITVSSVPSLLGQYFLLTRRVRILALLRRRGSADRLSPPRRPK